MGVHAAHSGVKVEGHELGDGISEVLGVVHPVIKLILVEIQV